MLLFPNGSRAADGTTATVLTGFNTTATSGLPVGVTLVAGAGASAVFDSAAVGSNIGISYTGYSLAGANAGQYALAGSCCVSGFRTTGTITAAVVTPPVVTPPVVTPPVVTPPVVTPPVVTPPVETPPVIVPPVTTPPVTTPVSPPVTTPVVTPPGTPGQPGQLEALDDEQGWGCLSFRHGEERASGERLEPRNESSHALFMTVIAVPDLTEAEAVLELERLADEL
eukprot:gene55926-76669_t